MQRIPWTSGDLFNPAEGAGATLKDVSVCVHAAAVTDGVPSHQRNLSSSGTRRAGVRGPEDG